MPRRTKQSTAPSQTEMLDITGRLRTGPCVPALREAVKAWKAGGYKGITDTTRLLLNDWFSTDHKSRTNVPFKYHASQQEAIETLIFVWEFEKVRTRKGLLEWYAQTLKDVRLPPYDEFARYCTKMATGSGKTKVMALAIAWQFFNAVREREDVAKDYAKTFLLIAPNVIVLERLKLDFASGRIFRSDPVIPKELEIFWDFDCIMRGDAEKAHAEGTLFLTNIQQFYERPDRSADDEPDAMTAVLGPRPPTSKLELSNFADRIGLRAGKLLVVNDEAHHTHDEESEWNEVIRKLHEKTPPVWEGRKCVFNLVPCDNDFEREFAKFLDNASDVKAFAKLPRAFGFTIAYTDAAMNLRNYEPDFVAVDGSGAHWLLESKGQETIEVLRKDAAAIRWCETATELTGQAWKYLKIPQREFEALQPGRLSDLAALAPSLI